MTRGLPWLLAAVAFYEAWAVHNHTPTISQIVRQTRQHFWTHCPTCGNPLIHNRTPYRGYLKIEER